MATRKTRKQAIHDLMDAYKALCEYQGIPYDASRYEVNVRSMADVVYKQQEVEDKMGLPIKPATEKQKAYMASLMSEQEKALFAGKVMNIYQASEVIRILLMEDELFDESDTGLKDFDMRFYELATIAELCKEESKKRKR